MLNRRRYTDSEIHILLKSMVILIDSREKSNVHITDYYDKKKIPYIKEALPSGDYSFMLTANPELGINDDMNFVNDIIIERKNSAEELSGCFAQTRERFNNEFYRSYAKRRYLLIENADYSTIVNGDYDTKYNSKSFLGSLHSFNIKHNLQVMFMPDRNYSAIYILAVFQYYLRYLLK